MMERHGERAADTSSVLHLCSAITEGTSVSGSFINREEGGKEKISTSTFTSSSGKC